MPSDCLPQDIDVHFRSSPLAAATGSPKSSTRIVVRNACSGVDFALAHLMLAYCTPDPKEEKAERQTAESLAAKVTPDERLLIVWLDGIRENNYVAGIAAMNDLLERYPKDKQLLMWSGSWLFHQQEYERAQKKLEQAVALDPGFASAWNDLGYIYAFQADYGRALAAMQHLGPVSRSKQPQ